MTDGGPQQNDCDPKHATSFVASSDASPLSSTARSVAPRSLLAATALLGLGVLICLLHWLEQRWSIGSLHGYLHWCAVIPAICGSAFAFLNRSHRLGPPLIAFGLLLLAICLRVRTADLVRANPAIILDVTSRSPVKPDEPLAIAIPDATVELAGISADWNGTLTSDWWRPNGVTVRKRSWSMAIGYRPHFPEGYSRRLVVRIHGSSTPARLLAFDFDGAPGACSEHSVITADDDADEWLVLSKIFGGNQTATAMRLLIGSGEFQGPDNHAAEKDFTTGAKGDFGDVQFTANIIEHAGKNAIQVVCHHAAAAPPYELRAGVIDRDGHMQVARRLDHAEFSTAAESSPDRTYLFDAPPGCLIANVVVERRPACWVEFHEVSLLARRETSAQAVLGHAPPIAD